MAEQIRAFLETKVMLEEPQLSIVEVAFKCQTFKKNEQILRTGEVCNNFYFIASGGIRVYFITQQGHEKTRHIALDNTIISALSSFISRLPSMELIVAMEDTELYAISHDDFFHLVQSCREWELFYRLILETAYITQTRRVETRVTLSAKQRYDLVMRDNPEFIQRVSNKVLASYLDITQETLSRLKSSHH